MRTPSTIGLCVALAATGAWAAPEDPAAVDQVAREIGMRGRTVALLTLVDPAVTFVPAPQLPPATNDRMRAVADREARFEASLDGAHVQVRRRFATFAGAIVDLDGDGLAALVRDERVRSLTADLPSHASDRISSMLIRATDEIAAGHDGSGVAVAVLDSGINTAHVDFQGQLLDGGYHFLSQGANTGPGGIEDDVGHGSNVAGIIGAKGVVADPGIAPGAKLQIIKVITAQGGWASDWTAAVDWVTAHRSDGAVPVRVINMSVDTYATDSGCPCGKSSAFSMATAAAHDSGIAVIVAAGNEGLLGKMPFPACFSSVLAVGATYDQSYGPSPASGTYQSKFGSDFAACADVSSPRELACFTNGGVCLKLVAPGAPISGPYVGGDRALGAFVGTSQAAPHASGVAAQVFAAYPSLSPEQVYAGLLASTQPRVPDVRMAGTSYAFLDAVDADATARCSGACPPSGPCDEPRCDASGQCMHVQKAAGASCGNPVCVGGVAMNSICTSSGVCVAMQAKNCSPYTCSPDGTACLDGCLADDDCTGGRHCFKGQCATSACAVDSSQCAGCSCSVMAPRSPSAMAALATLLLLAIAVRRRRSS